MIKKTIIINDLNDLKAKLVAEKLRYKGWLWDNYTFLPKKDYYRLVIFDNNEYGLFTQSQYCIVEAHQELNSADWRYYKPYADPDYKVMKENGVKAGTLPSSLYTVKSCTSKTVLLILLSSTKLIFNFLGFLGFFTPYSFIF